MLYKCYVRGHGGQEPQKLPPPSGHPKVDLITIGAMGCTMSDEVADGAIFQHLGKKDLQTAIDSNTIIYWTKAQRDNYYSTGQLAYSNPSLTVTPEDSIVWNLAVDGSNDIKGDCGLCYWDEAQGKLIWLKTLKHKETLLMADILKSLNKMLEDDNSVELYWTACLSADYWPGSGKKVSRNPQIKKANP